MTLPRKIKHKSVKQSDRIRCPGHLAFVREHRCCTELGKLHGMFCDGPIEAAHVRGSLDGGMGLKPGDDFCLSLCAFHHRIQHQIGEVAFEAEYGIDLKKLAQEFASKSPALARRKARARRAG